MQIFISYKREYEEFAHRLYELLQSWGFQPWLDVLNIPQGTESGTKGWDEAIHDAMKAAEVVIGLLTPEAIQSENVLDEWGWALSNRRRLFLLWMRDVAEENIPPRYIRIQRIDLRANQSTGLDKLREALSTPTLLIDSLKPEVPGFVSNSAVGSVIKTPRKQLINQVRSYWLEGVLDLALSDSEFDLGLTLKPDAVLTHADFGDYKLPDTSDVVRIFNDLGKELLILGAPGSGKTTLMLQLTRALLKQAEANSNQPIPVVFNLSTWTGRQSSLDKWLEEELVRNYQVSARSARNWIADERILPLLDGLDEVLQEKRDACVEAINQFRSQFRTVSIVVCSRIADYELLTKKLNLRSAIMLQPLSSEQSLSYVNSKMSWSGLRAVLKVDGCLQQMATNPFMLNTMLYAYDGLNAFEIGRNLEPVDRQKHLFDQYLKRRFETPGKYAINEVRTRLGWLAYQMNKQSESMFFTDDLYSPQWGIRRQLSVSGGVVVAVVMVGSILAIAWLLSVTGVFNYNNETLTTVDFGLLAIAVVASIWIAVLASSILGGARRMTSYQRGSRVRPRIRNMIVGMIVLIISTVALVPINIAAFLLRSGLGEGTYRVFTWIESLGVLVIIGSLMVIFTSGLSLVIPIAYRLYLSFRAPVPLRYARLLDFAVERGLMRQVGRGYIFRHRTLLEYFAELKKA